MIKSIFKLGADEDLLDDFGCTIKIGNETNSQFDSNQNQHNPGVPLKQKIGNIITYHGRLYITDQHICFNSDILGVIKKIKFPFSDIQSIMKSRVMGLFDTGITVVLVNGQKYKFGSFGNRDLAYSRMMVLWGGDHTPRPTKNKNGSGNAVSIPNSNVDDSSINQNEVTISPGHNSS